MASVNTEVKNGEISSEEVRLDVVGNSGHNAQDQYEKLITTDDSVESIDRNVVNESPPNDESTISSSSLCTESFLDPFSCQLHLLQHQLRNPFKCAICESAFPDSARLSEHIDGHQKELAQKSSMFAIAETLSSNQQPLNHVDAVTSDKRRTADASVEAEQAKMPRQRLRNRKPIIGSKQPVEENTEKVFPENRTNCLSEAPCGTAGERQANEATASSVSETIGEPPNSSRNTNPSRNGYQCAKCARSIKSDYHYQMHLRSCNGGGLRKRRNKVLSSLKKRQSHPCDICLKVCMSEYHLQIHKQKHQDKTARKKKIKGYSCSQCGKLFLNMTSLRHHTTYVHTSERNYKCDLCDKTFVRKNTLELHKRTHSSAQPFACDLCSATFKRKDAVLTHKKRKHKDCVREVQKKRSFFCQFCDQFFHERTHYKVHLSGELNKNTKKVMCDLCGNWYVSNGSLREHVRTVHERIRRFECNDCGQKFLQRSALNVHRSIHSSEKPFLCDTCGKAFRTKKVLERHKDSHSSVKSFQCNVCKKEFSRREHLTRHQKTHAPNRGAPERKFACGLCSRTFTTRRYLRDHETTHYREGDRPFKCEICGLRYSSEFDLQRHLLDHDGHRDILCPECDKHFKSSEQYHFHLRSAHDREPDPRITALIMSKRTTTGKRDDSMAATTVEPNFNPLQILDDTAPMIPPQNNRVQSISSVFAPLQSEDEEAGSIVNSPLGASFGAGQTRPWLPQMSPATGAAGDSVPPMARVYPAGYWTVASYRF